MGQTDIVRLMLDAGTDEEVRNKEGMRPLHVAAIYKPTSTVRLLVDAGAFTEARDFVENTPLHVATRCGRVDLKRRDWIGMDDIDRSSRDVWEGYAEVVRLLVEAGVDKVAMNWGGQTRSR
jgi:hypothetical protein